MASSSMDASKKRKRSPKLFSFHSFCNPDSPVVPPGSFRDSVRFFCRKVADVYDRPIGAMRVWCTLLIQERSGSIVVPLYTIEETVKYLNQPYCFHCQCCGWANHFVSKRRYHIIIPADDEWKLTLNKGVLVLDAQNHLLHGLVHSNGFGHLLRLNGIEGGSKILHGREIMDLWDRICTNLHARKISVKDVSTKRSVELRLLHGVAYRHPWYGKWGYRFCRGSFGVEEHHYNRAIEFLSSMNLDEIIPGFTAKETIRDINRIVRCYSDMSETQLTTLQELLKYMLTIKSWVPRRIKIVMGKTVVRSAALVSMKADGTKGCPQVRLCHKEKEKPGRCEKFASLVARSGSKWKGCRLEFAANVIVDALKEKRKSDPFNEGMTRQEVRDAARSYIGDTGMLDYVLKLMNNVIVGNCIVRRAINPANRILEYTLEESPDGGSTMPAQEKPRKFASLVASLKSRWPRKRLQVAANAIVDALKEKRESDPVNKGMSRQEVRDAARHHIGDTGLLDYVLKLMSNVIVGNCIVRHAINPARGILEYTLEESPDGGSTIPEQKIVEPQKQKIVEPQKPKCVVTSFSDAMPGADVYGDINCLYKHVLMGFPETESAGLAARVILNSKHFVKEWPLRDDDDQMLRFVCKILPISLELDLELVKRLDPGELVAVPLQATIGELKEAATQALRDTYCLTERYEVTEIEGLEGMTDEEPVFGLLESGSEIWVRGVGLDLKPELRYEGGPENSTVMCKCGAKDDDGERMVSCDACEIWQHTNCIGIKDSEVPPSLYLCQRCCSSLVPDQRVETSYFDLESCTDTFLLPSSFLC